jgi:phage anti-repressor protein
LKGGNMQSLGKIRGNFTESARALHGLLEVKKPFTQWFSQQKERLTLKLNVNFYENPEMVGPRKNVKKMDYLITKEIAHKIAGRTEVMIGGMVKQVPET